VKTISILQVNTLETAASGLNLTLGTRAETFVPVEEGHSNPARKQKFRMSQEGG
jgi:hypothetical protein